MMPGCVDGSEICVLRGYEGLASVNARIDGAVTVRLDESNNVIINDWLQFRPSETLHALDRIAYNDVVAALNDFGDAEPESRE